VDRIKVDLFPCVILIAAKLRVGGSEKFDLHTISTLVYYW